MRKNEHSSNENIKNDYHTTVKAISELPTNKGEVILYRSDDSLRLEVLLENETVWLTIDDMARLFERSRSTINEHVLNIYAEDELNEISSMRKIGISDFSTKPTNYYNLDVIISVGYRVKSKRGTQFRQWANHVLKEYLLRGYAINGRIEQIERRVTETENKIDFFVRTSLPPVQGVFFEGQIFDAYVFVSNLIRSAKRSVVLIDNYVDESVLLLLSKRMPTVTADIHTKRMSPQLQQDMDKHNSQYEAVNVYEADKVHDRFLIIDNIVYHVGSSFKDLGRKLFAFSKMEMNIRMSSGGYERRRRESAVPTGHEEFGSA